MLPQAEQIRLMRDAVMDRRIDLGNVMAQEVVERNLMMYQIQRNEVGKSRKKRWESDEWVAIPG